MLWCLAGVVHRHQEQGDEVRYLYADHPPRPSPPPSPHPGVPDAAALLVPADGAAGQTTCAGRAGGLYHEYIDAATYAEWGAEYLKYDVRAHPLLLRPAVLSHPI